MSTSAINCSNSSNWSSYEIAASGDILIFLDQIYLTSNISSLKHYYQTIFPCGLGRYLKLFPTEADRHNNILMSLLLPVAETINTDTVNFFPVFPSNTVKNMVFGIEGFMSMVTKNYSISRISAILITHQGYV